MRKHDSQFTNSPRRREGTRRVHTRHKNEVGNHARHGFFNKLLGLRAARFESSSVVRNTNVTPGVLAKQVAISTVILNRQQA
jgi:hypothetical protein